MTLLSKYLSGQSLRIPLLLLVLTGSVSLAGCGGPLDLLMGGPNVAANTQVGKTNNQTIGTTENTEQTILRPQARDIRQSKDTNKVQAQEVQTVVVNEVPVWVILLLILGWLLPSPNEIIQTLFGRKRNGTTRKS